MLIGRSESIGGIATMYETSGNASVEIQGPRVLEILRRTDEHADFSVIGFEGSITIRDYRPDTIASLLAFELGEPNHDFADRFSQPAFLELAVLNSSSMHVDMYPVKPGGPTLQLWIAVGVDGTLPTIDYTVSAIRPLEEGKFALVALYTTDDQVVTFDPLQSSQVELSSVA